MPQTLLERLTHSFQSGEQLAQALGVSRAAIHKAVSSLESAGVPLERGRDGYRLVPGTPAPHLLAARLEGRFGKPYTYLAETSSTQDVLRQQAEAGALEGTVVLAERQTQGRGRRGRAWNSPPGAGLYFSLLLRPQIPLERLPLLSLAAGVALVEVCGHGRLKWPNDLLALDGRKLAGVLLEGDFRGEELRYVLLGIGLNVHQHEGQQGAALEEYQPVDRLGLLVRMLAALEHWLCADPEQVLSAWTCTSCTLGNEVCLTLEGKRLQGLATVLDASGALLIQTEHGLERVTAGDVQLVGHLKDNP